MDPIRKKREHGDTTEEDRSRQKVAKTEESTIPLTQQYVYMYVRMHMHICMYKHCPSLDIFKCKQTYVVRIIVQKCYIYVGQVVQ